MIMLGMLCIAKIPGIQWGYASELQEKQEKFQQEQSRLNACLGDCVGDVEIFEGALEQVQASEDALHMQFAQQVLESLDGEPTRQEAASLLDEFESQIVDWFKSFLEEFERERTKFIEEFNQQSLTLQAEFDRQKAAFMEEFNRQAIEWLAVNPEQREALEAAFAQQAVTLQETFTQQTAALEAEIAQQNFALQADFDQQKAALIEEFGQREIVLVEGFCQKMYELQKTFEQRKTELQKELVGGDENFTPLEKELSAEKFELREQNRDLLRWCETLMQKVRECVNAIIHHNAANGVICIGFISASFCTFIQDVSQKCAQHLSSLLPRGNGLNVAGGLIAILVDAYFCLTPEYQTF